MVSFDVKSLFTSIPVDLALTITKDRLQWDQNLAGRSYLSVDNVLKLSDFVLNHNYFKYDGDHYKQIFGGAIHPCHTAAILSRETKRALFYHAKPRNGNHGDEA